MSRAEDAPAWAGVYCRVICCYVAAVVCICVAKGFTDDCPTVFCWVDPKPDVVPIVCVAGMGVPASPFTNAVMMACSTSFYCASSVFLWNSLKNVCPPSSWRTLLPSYSPFDLR